MHASHPASNALLLLVVFLAGIGTLGIEMVMPRLLAPFFGTSQPIWAVVIGMTLIYLAAGYWLGGHLADRWPDRRILFQLITWAGFLCGTIPLLAHPILQIAQQAIGTFSASGFLGALAAVVLLFAAPVILLATVAPFAVRLQMHAAPEGIAAAGRVAGTISALSTLGSILGTFVTVLVLIPWIGTTKTIYLFAAFLMLIGLVGLPNLRSVLMFLIIVVLAALTLTSSPRVKLANCSTCHVLAETESRYNYIQVVQQQFPPEVCGMEAACDPIHYLVLNEGHAIHSIYRTSYRHTRNPLDLLTGGGPWDYFSVAPYVYAQRGPSSIRSAAILGAGAGTVPKQLLAIYGPQTRIDGVEIDPRIVEMGQHYFDMEAGDPNYPNYTVYIQDARSWLASTTATYDLVGVDAYRQPYIPFHLVTVEFFQEAREHLNADGVVVVNAARPPGRDDRIVNAIATTMRAVFPQVFILDTRGTGDGASNAMIIGVNRPVGDGAANFAANATAMPVDALRLVMAWSLHEGDGPVREFTPAQAAFEPFTDDRAPVEMVMDMVIFDEAQQLIR